MTKKPQHGKEVSGTFAELLWMHADAVEKRVVDQRGCGYGTFFNISEISDFSYQNVVQLFPRMWREMTSTDHGNSQTFPKCIFAAFSVPLLFHVLFANAISFVFSKFSDPSYYHYFFIPLICLMVAAYIGRICSSVRGIHLDFRV